MTEEQVVYSVRTGWVPRANFEDTQHEAPELGELFTALSKAQGEMEGASKGKVNPAFKSKYADLASVWDAVREPLSKNGLSVIQLPCPAPDGKVGVVTVLGHSSGQSLSQVFHMPVRNASNAQDVGSALTYARRYALMAVCGIAPEDDDGNAAAGKIVTAPIDTSAVKQQLTVKFAGASNVEEQKAVFSETRNSQLPDKEKSELLTKMSEIIKAAAPAAAKGKSK